MARHRNLKFVSVDSTNLEMSIEKKLGLKPFHGSHQLLHFARYNVTAKPKVRFVCVCMLRVCMRDVGIREVLKLGLAYTDVKISTHLPRDWRTLWVG